MANHNNAVQINSADARTFQLTSAILIYSTGGFNSETFATLHGIERQQKGGPVLAPGVPATKEACAEFARTIAEQAAFAGFLSPELLYVGPRLVAWWRAPKPARVWFECEDREDPKKNLGTRNAYTPQPGLVFVLNGERWHVYAVKGTARPTPETRLYRAPYFNLWKNGHICEGNIERPKRVTPATIARFERAFFDSRFTHPNAQGLTRYKGGIYALWRDLLDSRWKDRFPQETLAPEGKLTLEECIRKHEAGKGKYVD